MFVDNIKFCPACGSKEIDTNPGFNQAEETACDLKCQKCGLYCAIWQADEEQDDAD